MAMTKTELATARESTQRVLDRVGLPSFVFEVEPADVSGRCAVHVEHPRDGAWHTATIVATSEELRRALEDEGERARMARSWRQSLLGGDGQRGGSR